MRIVIFVLVSMIVGAIASPIAAETRGSDFTHSVELIHQNGVDFLRLEIRPDIRFLKGRFSSSLTDVDVTPEVSARGMQVFSSGETRVATRAAPAVAFEIPITTHRDGFHTIGITLRLGVGPESRDAGGFPIFLRVVDGRASIMSLDEWGDAHSAEAGPCKGKVCFQRPQYPPIPAGEQGE